MVISEVAVEEFHNESVEINSVLHPNDPFKGFFDKLKDNSSQSHKKLVIFCGFHHHCSFLSKKTVKQFLLGL